MIGWIVTAVVIVAFVVMLYARRRMRQQENDRLIYSIEKPTNPYAKLADAMYRMAGHHSVGEWKRRCEASLQASRRRRGKH